MEEYSWSFNKNTECWHGSASTVEECIEQARELDRQKEFTFIYIGKNTPYIPYVAAEEVLERIENNALDFSDIAESWDTYDPQKNEELVELSEKLSAVTNEWLNKHGYTPSFYRVEDIKRYPLC